MDEKASCLDEVLLGYPELKSLFDEIDARRAELTDEERLAQQKHRLEGIELIRSIISGIEAEAASRVFLTPDESNEKRKVELGEDLVVFKEMLADGTTPFGSKHMPIDIARMIAGTICPDSLLKEEIGLLRSVDGRAYLFMTMLKEAHATDVVFGGGKGIFRRGGVVRR